MGAPKLEPPQENLLRAFGLIERAGEDGRKMTFIASTEARDRHGTVIPIDAWRLDNFNKNPIIAYMHETSGDFWSGRPADPDYILGPGKAWIEKSKLMVEIDFEDQENDLNPLAEKIYRKLKKGSIRAVSVGFRYLKGHWGLQEDGEDTGTYYFDEIELLEISVVNIPSNPEALKERFTRFLNSVRATPEAEVTTTGTEEQTDDPEPAKPDGAKLIELEHDQARLNYLKLIAK